MKGSSFVVVLSPIGLSWVYQRLYWETQVIEDWIQTYISKKKKIVEYILN